MLGGLDAGAATRLSADAIGANDLPASVAARVLASSEGNPLFVGELVRMLVHEGGLRREGERRVASADAASLAMPPTIQALLAARIERLPVEDRTVLEYAAVIGRQFSRAAVAHLLSSDASNSRASCAQEIPPRWHECASSRPRGRSQAPPPTVRVESSTHEEPATDH